MKFGGIVLMRQHRDWSTLLVFIRGLKVVRSTEAESRMVGEAKGQSSGVIVYILFVFGGGGAGRPVEAKGGLVGVGSLPTVWVSERELRSLGLQQAPFPTEPP